MVDKQIEQLDNEIEEPNTLNSSGTFINFYNNLYYNHKFKTEPTTPTGVGILNNVIDSPILCLDFDNLQPDTYNMLLNLINSLSSECVLIKTKSNGIHLYCNNDINYREIKTVNGEYFNSNWSDPILQFTLPMQSEKVCIDIFHFKKSKKNHTICFAPSTTINKKTGKLGYYSIILGGIDTPISLKLSQIFEALAPEMLYDYEKISAVYLMRAYEKENKHHKIN